jgi:hypothetical protein
MLFQKGNKHGKGRPPILLPEVQSLIDENRNAVKVSILSLLSLSKEEFENKSRNATSMMEQTLCLCIERIATDGDVIKLRALLEVALGKLPEDRHEFEMSSEEKALVIEYRKRLEEQNAVAISAKDPG